MEPDPQALATIPARFAQPDPSTLATLPKGGANLLYMGHAEVTLALIDADPAWNWRPLAFDVDDGRPVIDRQGDRLVLWGYLSLCGVERLCVGTCEARKGDPEKELIGDLLRNGAMRFGIGTKLWSKATDADPAGSGSAGFNRRNKREPEPAPVRTPGMDLFERAKSAPDAVKERLRALAAENGTTVGAAAFDADPRWAELVAAELAEVQP